MHSFFTEIAISSPMVWFYGEMGTVFMIAFLLLGLFGLRVWDGFNDCD